MRVANWRAPEVFGAITEAALDSAGGVMDDIVVRAKIACPVLKNLDQERPPGWSSATVSFTPKTGRNKGKPVKFSTTRRWTGRKQGDLQRTIREVTREDRIGNFRVYAGNYKIYYAHMIEKSGYTDRSGKFHPPIPFLRNAFNGQKVKAIDKIRSGVNSKIATVG